MEIMANELGAKVRAARLARRLTQAQLAQRAGVSRQLVAAVEAGRNAPAVDAALRIASALGSTVEALFTVADDAVIGALGELPREGAMVRAARVGSRTVAFELPDRGASLSGWTAADGLFEHGRLELFGGAELDRLVVAGCDPALGIAEAMLSGRGPASLLALPAPTDTAAGALLAGRLHAAAIHGPSGSLPSPAGPVLRLHLARWQAGVGLAAGAAARSLEEILERSIAIVQRDPAAATQQALARAADALGLPMPAGPLASGHLEAARRARMQGCAGLMTESAARAFGLVFLPLEEHTVEIWVASEFAGHPGAASLGELVASRAFQDRLSALGGYDVADTGRVGDQPLR
jgi:transcriptional regulator with XRE-family HTH domain